MTVFAIGAATSASARLLADEDTGKAGPLGFLIIILLIVASYFLFKSMSRHLRRVREDFPDGGQASATSAQTALPADAVTDSDAGPQAASGQDGQSEPLEHPTA